jgi:hypothetical protein
MSTVRIDITADNVVPPSNGGVRAAITARAGRDICVLHSVSRHHERRKGNKEKFTRQI